MFNDKFVKICLWDFVEYFKIEVDMVVYLDVCLEEVVDDFVFIIYVLGVVV